MRGLGVACKGVCFQNKQTGCRKQAEAIDTRARDSLLLIRYKAVMIRCSLYHFRDKQPKLHVFESPVRK